MKINIHLGDSLKAMRSMPANKYGLAICDPEWGINSSKKKQYHANAFTVYKAKNWDICRSGLEYFNKLAIISEDQIIWGANYFTDYLKPAKNWIVWDKMQPEGISFSMHELAFYSGDGQAKIFKWYNGANRCTDKSKARKYTRIHQTQKPVALYKWLLKNYAFNKDGSKRTIFDSHGGSMSIVIACIDLGFDIDIWEIDEDYYTDAANRIKRHLAQHDLTRELVDINYIID